MKAVTIDTDPRPVEAVVTGEGGMERSTGPSWSILPSGFNVAQAISALTSMAAAGSVPYVPSGWRSTSPDQSAGSFHFTAPKYQGDRVDAFRMSLSVMPSAQRCRSVLTPIEGIS